MTRSTTTSLLLLVLVCTAAAASEWQSSVSTNKSTRLNAVWSGWTGSLNITQLDPLTAAEGEALFLSNAMAQLFPVTPAVDVRGQRLFVPVVGATTGDLAVFDLSTPGKATLQKRFGVPGAMFFATQYDSVKNTVWLLSAALNSAGDRSEDIYVTSVDLSRGLVQRVGFLPPGVVPAMNGMGGGPVVIDEKNRELVISAMHISSGGRNYSLVKFNLDTHKYTTIPLDDMWPGAMARDVESGTVYALLQHQQTGRQPLAFGTVDTLTGKLNVISQWNNTNFVFIVGSLAAYDSASAQFYSLVGHGTGPPVAVATVSAKTGQLVHSAYSRGKQPSGLFVF